MEWEFSTPIHRYMTKHPLDMSQLVPVLYEIQSHLEANCTNTSIRGRAKEVRLLPRKRVIRRKPQRGNFQGRRNRKGAVYDYRYLFSSRSSYDCTISPIWKSLQSSKLIPHSLPFFISVTSFLTFFRLDNLPGFHQLEI